jgi:hypothetical protein
LCAAKDLQRLIVRYGSDPKIDHYGVEDLRDAWISLKVVFSTDPNLLILQELEFKNKSSKELFSRRISYTASD